MKVKITLSRDLFSAVHLYTKLLITNIRRSQIQVPTSLINSGENKHMNKTKQDYKHEHEAKQTVAKGCM